MPWVTSLIAEVGQAPRVLGGTLHLSVAMVVIGALFLGTLAVSRISLRIGIPAILGVLLLGLAINTHYILFSRATLETLHILSTSMLLFYAGLRTELRSIRGFLEYGVALAVGGVIVSSLLLGLIIWFVASPTAASISLGFNQIPLGAALLVAGCLGSTDAGATISVLASLRQPIPARLKALLEFESSLNDPAAVLFLGLVIGLFTVGRTDGSHFVLIEQLQIFVQKIGSGLLIGVLLGYLARFALERLVDEQEQLLLLGVAIALLTYGIADQLGGSGFIAVYATGLFMSNHIYRNSHISAQALQLTLQPFNTMTEITIFLIFGLSMHPGRMLASLPEGVLVALGMMFIARPISVLIFQPLSPFRLRESLLVSWCGLRGALPLALAFAMVESLPRLRGVDPELVDPLMANAEVIVFTVVVLNLLIQGLTLPWVCRWLGLSPEAEESPQLPNASP